MENQNFKNLMWFYESLNYRISAPTNPDRNTKIGVTWMRGHLGAEDYEREIKVPLVEGGATDEMVTLERFEEPGDDESVDPVYYDTHEKLANFEDPVAVKAEMEDFIGGVRKEGGERRPEKGRRKQRRTERQLRISEQNYEENTRCRICKKPANLKGRRPVLQTRCDCYLKEGRTPSAMRFHMQCLNEERRTMISCDMCEREILLPVREKRQRRGAPEDPDEEEKVEPERTFEDEEEDDDLPRDEEEGRPEGESRAKKPPVAFEYDPESPPYYSSEPRELPFTPLGTLRRTLDSVPSGRETGVGPSPKPLRSVQELRELFRPKTPENP